MTSFPWSACNFFLSDGHEKMKKKRYYETMRKKTSFIFLTQRLILLLGAHWSHLSHQNRLMLRLKLRMSIFITVFNIIKVLQQYVRKKLNGNERDRSTTNPHTHVGLTHNLVAQTKLNSIWIFYVIKVDHKSKTHKIYVRWQHYRTLNCQSPYIDWHWVTRFITECFCCCVFLVWFAFPHTHTHLSHKHHLYNISQKIALKIYVCWHTACGRVLQT